MSKIGISTSYCGLNSAAVRHMHNVTFPCLV